MESCLPILSLFILTFTALVILLLGAYFPENRTGDTAALKSFNLEKSAEMLTIGALSFSLLCTFFYQGYFGPGEVIFNDALYIDPLTWYSYLLILFGSLLTSFILFQRLEHDEIESKTEFLALFLFCIIGALVFCAAADFLTLFVGLEIMSLSLYPLCCARLMRVTANEAAFKYFLFGSFFSSFLLLGVALFFGLTGSTSLAAVQKVILGTGTIFAGNEALIILASAFVIIGILFKIGVVPFHFWAVDVYTGSYTPITTFMSSVVKGASLCVAIRFLWMSLSNTDFWIDGLWWVSLLTMLVGNIAAVRQRNVKRLLAYSSLAHAGYLSAALLVPTNQFGGGSAILYYLTVYTIVTFGCFTILNLVSDRALSEQYEDSLDLFKGLAKSEPIVAVLMSFFLLTLAGLPPALAGLFGKFYIFSALVKEGFYTLAGIGILSSVISCFYYLKIIVAMYVDDVNTDILSEKTSSYFNLPVKLALLFCFVTVVFIGITPGYLYYKTAVIMSSVLP
jgi:NADH-quinone oxidoreductase subunit N